MEAAFAAAGVADMAERVLIQRALPVGHDRFPCCCIYAFPESNEIFDTELFRRELSLNFEFMAQGDEAEVDAQLDAFSNQLERELLLREDLGGLVDRIILTETEQDYVTQARKLVGAARLTFNVIYYSPRFVPEPGTDLKNVSVNPGEFTEDSVTLPT